MDRQPRHELACEMEPIYIYLHECIMKRGFAARAACSGRLCVVLLLLLAVPIAAAWMHACVAVARRAAHGMSGMADRHAGRTPGARASRQRQAYVPPAP